jgi:hypothetical protein
VKNITIAPYVMELVQVLNVRMNIAQICHVVAKQKINAIVIWNTNSIILSNHQSSGIGLILG